MSVFGSADWWMIALAWIGAVFIAVFILLCLSPLLPEGHERSHRSGSRVRDWWHRAGRDSYDAEGDPR